MKSNDFISNSKHHICVTLEIVRPLTLWSKRLDQKFEFVQMKKSRIKIFINFNRVQITLKLFSIDHT